MQRNERAATTSGPNPAKTATVPLRRIPVAFLVIFVLGYLTVNNEGRPSVLEGQSHAQPLTRMRRSSSPQAIGDGSEKPADRGGQQQQQQQQQQRQQRQQRVPGISLLTTYFAARDRVHEHTREIEAALVANVR